MKTVMFQNKTNKIQYPGGIMVRPGDCRPVPATALGLTETPVFDPVVFVTGKVNDVKKGVKDLTDEQILPVYLAEENGDKRSSLLERISYEAEQRDIDIDGLLFINEIQSLSVEELQQRLLDEDVSDIDRNHLLGEIESREENRSDDA